MRNVLSMSIWPKTLVIAMGAALCLSLLPKNALAQYEGGVKTYQNSYFDVASSFRTTKEGWGGPGSSGGAGDNVVRIVNPTDDNLCANLYVFDDDEQLEECCSCPVSCGGLLTLSTIVNLTSNPYHAGNDLTDGIISVITARPSRATGACDPGLAATKDSGLLVTDPSIRFQPESLKSAISHPESMASNNPGFTPPFGFITSTSVTNFTDAQLEPSTEFNLEALCSVIQIQGSKAGICNCGPQVSTGATLCPNLF